MCDWYIIPFKDFDIKLIRIPYFINRNIIIKNLISIFILSNLYIIWSSVSFFNSSNLISCITKNIIDINFIVSPAVSALNFVSTKTTVGEIFFCFNAFIMLTDFWCEPFIRVIVSWISGLWLWIGSSKSSIPRSTSCRYLSIVA